ncbi:MAG TPA: RNA polymerase sigma factor, partial [Saprospiraceae bacterium]|nr:RNA polymerase sigma factor [Saprospiraceae bacterium]
DIPDEELVREYLKTQNMRYFDILYTRYSGKVLAKCITFLKDTEASKDLMQDIFMKVLLSISTFKYQSKFSTWLYTITYNTCIDETRRLKKYTFESDEKLDSLADIDVNEKIEEEALLNVKVHQVETILNQINMEDRSVLLMKYCDDMGINEMSEVLNKSSSAVKMKLMRARERFLNVYKLHYDGFDEE